ncbi:transposase [Culicoidibacter larvae]|nr:transposase [Culicoidibacter larvae]
MSNRYSIEERYTIVNRERKEKSVKEICTHYKISRTTYYNWERSFKIRITNENKLFTYRDVQLLEEKNRKLKKIIEIYNRTGCSIQFTLYKKIRAIEKTEGRIVDRHCRKDIINN